MDTRKMITGALLILVIVIVGADILLFKDVLRSVKDEEQEAQQSLVEVTIRGNSMEPTLHDGDVFMGDTSRETLANLKAGDVIILREPEQTSQDAYLAKRIVALGGDVVEIKYGQLYVNKVYKDYGSSYKKDFGPYTVEKNAVFVIGDNALISMDSRSFDNPSLSLDLVIGRLILEP